MKHGSLFSGIGGFDLAAEWMGWENVFHCEWNEFGKKILKYYWPEAISYDDITKTDFSIHRGTIDILTGGFPCQPYSLSGKRKGKADERHLWPEMLRAIREIQPRWVVGENVRGLVNWNGGMVFHEVQSEMEAEGYEVFPFLLPACGVNAPHERYRIWFVAHSNKDTMVQNYGQEAYFNKEWNNQGNKQKGQSITNELGSNFKIQNVTNSDKTRFTGNVCGKLRSISNQVKPQSGSEFVRGITKANGWDEFPSESPIRGGDDGLSKKLADQCLEGFGNAIVPQVAHQIFKAIEQYELLTNNKQTV